MVHWLHVDSLVDRSTAELAGIFERSLEEKGILEDGERREENSQ